MKRILVTLLLLITLGAGVSWAVEKSYKVPFKTAEKDPSNAVDVTAGTIFDDLTYVSAASGTSVFAPGIYGARLNNSSSKDGSLTVTLSEAGQVVPKKVNVGAAVYATASGTIDALNFTVDLYSGETLISSKPIVKADFATGNKIQNFEISIPTNDKPITKIEFKATAKRVYLGYFEVVYEDATDTRVQANLSFNGYLDNNNICWVNMGESNNFPELKMDGVNDVPDEIDVTWTSSDPSIATVSASGVITLLRRGQVDITAEWGESTNYVGGSAKYTLDVWNPAIPGYTLANGTTPEKLLDLSTAVIYCVGRNTAMGAYNASTSRFMDADAGYRDVDGNGVKVYPDDDVTIVTLERQADGRFALKTKDGKYINLPETGKIVTQDTPAFATLTFDGNNALITFDGNLTLKHSSSSNFFAGYSSGQVAVQLYTIPDPRQELTLTFDQPSYEVERNKTLTTKVSNLPAGLTVTYTSDDTEIASVNRTTGMVTGLKDGTTTIRAKFDGNKDYKPAEASYEIVVKSARIPAGLTFGVDYFEADLAAASVAFPQLTPANYNGLTVTFESSNPKYASIDSRTGVITLKKKGSTTITASWEETTTYIKGSVSYELKVIDSSEKPFTLLNAASAVYNGAKIVIVSNGNKVMGLPASLAANNVAAVDGEITTEGIYPNDETMAILELEKVDGGYALKLTNNESEFAGKYFYHPAGTNYLKLQDEPQAVTLAVAPGGDAAMTFKDGNPDSRYLIQYYKSSNYFSAYSSVQGPIQIYMLPDTRKTPEIAFNKTEMEVEAGEVINDVAVTVNPSTLQVVYTSDNTDVATVAVVDGKLTITTKPVDKAETVHITASTVDTKEYKSVSAELTLTVVKKLETIVPIITPNRIQVNMTGNFEVNTPKDFFAGVTDFALAVDAQYASSLKVAYNEEEGVWDFETGEVTGEIPVKATWAAGSKYKAGEKNFIVTILPPSAPDAPEFIPEAGTYPYNTHVTIAGGNDRVKIYYWKKGENDNPETPEAYKGNAIEYTRAGFDLNVPAGEHTYYAYAYDTMYEQESEIATVTYVVTKASAADVFGYNVVRHTAHMGDRFADLPALNNPENLPYTLSVTDIEPMTPGGDVVIVALNDPNKLWVLGRGKAVVTATTEGNEYYEGTSSSYTITVNRELGAMISESEMFNFAVNNYGLGSSYVTDKPITEGKVTLNLSTITGKGYKYYNGLQPYKGNVKMTFTVDPVKAEDAVISSIVFKFVNGSGIASYQVGENGTNTSVAADASTFTVDCINQNSNVVDLFLNVTSNKDIASITVNFSHPGGVGSHNKVNLAFDGETRDVLLGENTVVKGIETPDIPNVYVGYTVMFDGVVMTDYIKHVEADQVTVYGGDKHVPYNSTSEVYLVAYVNPELTENTSYFGEVVKVPLKVLNILAPEQLYVHGHFNDAYYDLTAPVVMTQDPDNKKVYHAEEVYLGGAFEGEAPEYVYATSFVNGDPSYDARKRVVSRAQAVNWSDLTDGTIYDKNGAYAASDVTDHSQLTPFTADKTGYHNLTADFSDPENPAITSEYVDSPTTGIENIAIDNTVKGVQYYDLTGRRIEKPSTGVVIRVENGVAEKVVIK